MPAEATKEVLKSIRQQSPTLKLSNRKYKEAYSHTVMTLVEEVLRENERLERQSETLDNMLKVLVNQSQLAVSEMKQLRKAVMESANKLKSLPKFEEDDGEGVESEEIDHKGE